MKKQIVVVALALGVVVSGTVFASPTKDAGELAGIGKAVFGVDVDKEEVTKMMDKKPLPKECRVKLDGMTEGVKITNRKEFREWGKSNKSDIQKMCMKKKLTKKQCLQMLVRYFTK